MDQPIEVAANGGEQPHHRAVAMHLEASIQATSSETLRRVSRGWDQTLWDPDFRALLLARICALGGRRSPERTAVELGTAVAMDLAHGWSTSGATWPHRQRGVLRIAHDRVIREHARHFTAGLNTLAQPDALSPLILWESWVELRNHYAKLIELCSPTRMRAFYEAVNVVVAGLVVLLERDRNQRSIAHAIALWLVREAERIHNGSAAAHHRLAVALGP